MKEEARVLDVVLQTLRDESDDLGYPTLSDPTEATTIYGGDAGIDSLSLVRLISALERNAERSFGQRVVLADEKAMSMRNSPYRDAGSLARLLQERLGAGHA
jgi:acyl carrier protein